MPSIRVFLMALHTLVQQSEGRDRLARANLFFMKFARGLLRFHIARTPSLRTAPPPDLSPAELSGLVTPRRRSLLKWGLPATTLEFGPLSYDRAATTGPPCES